MIIESTISKIIKQVQTGKTPSTMVKEYFNGEYSWYTPSDLNKKLLSTSSRTITNKAYEDKKAVAYPKGTVLLSCIGDIGKVGITIDEVSSSNQQITGLILDKDKIIPEYFYYWCIAHKYIFEKSATNAVVPILNNKRLKSIKIWYEEDILEQRKIANLLSRIENLFQKREKSIELLDSLIRSTFLDMFGDPILNPLKWQVKKFGENIEYIGDIGSNGSNTNVAANLDMFDKENYALMVRTINLNTNDFKKNVKYVSKKTYDYFSKSKIYGGEIIMNKIGSAGQFWIMPNLNRPVSLGLNQLMIRLKDLNTYYLYYYLSTHYGKVNIKSRVKGAVTKSITKTAVKDIPLLFPPQNLQDKFADLVIKIENTKKIYENSFAELKQLFKSTSQKAFKGELDLNIVTLKFKDEFSNVSDEIIKKEEKHTLHFEKGSRKFSREKALVSEVDKEKKTNKPKKKEKSLLNDFINLGLTIGGMALSGTVVKKLFDLYNNEVKDNIIEYEKDVDIQFDENFLKSFIEIFQEKEVVSNERLMEELNKIDFNNTPTFYDKKEAFIKLLDNNEIEQYIYKKETAQGFEESIAFRIKK